MTTDEFNTKYTLLKQIAHVKGRSFTAQECASGRAVLVHFTVDDGLAPGTTVATLIDRLTPRDRSKILEILAVNLSTVVVTQFLEDFESFGAWLESRLAGPSAPAPSSQPLSPAGEFTKLFEPPAVSPPTPPAPAVAAPEGAPRGSFTDLFRPPEPKANSCPIPAPAAPPVEILSVRIPLGQPAVPRPAAPRPAAPMPSWPMPFQEPQAPPPPSPVLPPPIMRPRQGEPIVKPPQRDLLPVPAPLPGWAGESDYTRQLRPVQGPSDPAPPAAAPEPAPESSGGGSRSLLPLLLVLNIVVIIATGLILYFALKRN